MIASRVANGAFTKIPNTLRGRRLLASPPDTLAAIIALPTSLATAQAPTIIVGGIPYTSKPTAVGPSMKSLWTVPRSGVRPRLYRRSEKQIKDILFRDVDGTHENG
jgi:hypothetical protein